MMDGWTLAGIKTPDEVGWGMLRETFAGAYAAGRVAAVDPVAADDPTLGLRLYEMDDFYLLIAAPKAASTAVAPATAMSRAQVADSAAAGVSPWSFVPPNQQGPICLEPFYPRAQVTACPQCFSGVTHAGYCTIC